MTSSASLEVHFDGKSLKTKFNSKLNFFNKKSSEQIMFGNPARWISTPMKYSPVRFADVIKLRDAR